MAQVVIAGTGTYLPGEPIPFDQIDTVLGELNNAPPRIQKWMKSTGRVMKELLDIEYAHYAIDPITREFTDDNVSMSVKAAQAALDAAGMVPQDIDLICYGSSHQDQMPTASVRIQEALGIEICDELSIHANCTSAYKALYLAHELIKAGKNQNALVLSSNIASSELRAEYYNQELVDKESLFLRWFLSDGAGATVLSADPSRSSGFELEFTYIESVGGKRPSLMFNKRPALWLNPKDEYEQGLHHLRQSFRNALSTAVFQEKDGSVFMNGFKRMVERGGIPLGQVKLFQVNMPAKHIVDSVVAECAALGLDPSLFYTKLDQLGYCGPPMALICLDKIVREETLEPNDLVVSFVTEVSKFMQAGYSIKYVGR
jgi:3-oxoacyl-[acyl-carrier-protein] synthase III